MNPDTPPRLRKWYSGGLWALVFAAVGILIIAFMIATGAKYATWLLWIAIPLLMISLGYFFVVNAIKYFLR